MWLSLKSRKKLIDDIMSLIENSTDGWRKAAFYSDEDVNRLLNELYSRWESSKGLGMPLDYATEEELIFLHEKALKLSKAGAQALKKAIRRVMLSRD